MPHGFESVIPQPPAPSAELKIKFNPKSASPIPVLRDGDVMAGSRLGQRRRASCQGRNAGGPVVGTAKQGPVRSCSTAASALAGERAACHFRRMEWRTKPPAKRPGLVEPCIPTRATKPPVGSQWIHEIKHDGYRLIARKRDDRVRLFTRNGFDWTNRYPRVSEAVTALRTASVTIDGGVVRRRGPCDLRQAPQPRP